MSLFLSISMANNVISCKEIAENTQIFKIAIRFIILAPDLRNHQKKTNEKLGGHNFDF